MIGLTSKNLTMNNYLSSANPAMNTTISQKIAQAPSNPQKPKLHPRKMVGSKCVKKRPLEKEMDLMQDPQAPNH
jgi:hypothetical protein